VRNGTLFLKPTLTSDMYGEDFLTSGVLNLHGGAPADEYVPFTNYVVGWSLSEKNETEAPNITIN
jgi:hypothetical protein